MTKSLCVTKLDVMSFGFALAIVWGLILLAAGFSAWGTGWGMSFVDNLGTGYIGFGATPMGSVIGFVWGFVSMYIIGAVVAGLYNLSVAIRCRCSGKEMPHKDGHRHS